MSRVVLSEKRRVKRIIAMHKWGYTALDCIHDLGSAGYPGEQEMVDRVYNALSARKTARKR